MRAIIACAGTGGHINPGIAIASIIKEQERDSEFLFIGTETGIENELVTKAGYDIEHIRTGKLYRKLTLKNFKSIAGTIAGINDAKKIMKNFKPDIVIGTGGYICGAVMLAAKSLKIPYILHESNAFPGVAVKLLAKKAAKVLVGFEDTKPRLKNKSNVVYTGSPAKFNSEKIENLDKEICLKELGLDKYVDGRKIIFVTGGSQGAKKFNEVVVNLALEKKSNKFFVVLCAGMKNYDAINEKLKQIKDADKYIKLERFVFDMDKMYKVSDLLITRAGAMTITELTLAAKPAILVPFPYAAENHQYYNAKVLEDAGAGKIIIESDFSEETLYAEIEQIINSEDKLKIMSDSSKSLRKNDVEQIIYDEILDALKG